jgi:hypothetical protein
MSNENEVTYCCCLKSIAFFFQEKELFFDRIYKQLRKDQNELCVYVWLFSIVEYKQTINKRKKKKERR